MHHFTGNWTKFIKYAVAWERLSLEARRLFLTLKVDVGVKAAEFGTNLEPLIKARFLTHTTDIHVRLNNEALGFRRAMRSMERHPIFGNPAHATLREYFKDNFTKDEIEGLTRGHGWQRGNADQLAHDTETDQWILDFLSAKPEAWVRSRTDGLGPLPLTSQESYQACQEFARTALQWTAPVPIERLPSLMPRLSHELLDFVLQFCISYALLFPALDGKLTPVIGLWPAVTARIHRPKPTAPSKVAPLQQLQLAYRLEDITTLLVAICSEGLRVRANDYGIFEKTRMQIEANLLALPEWIGRFHSGAGEHRLDIAKRCLYEMKLVEPKGRAGKDLRLEGTEKAESWLAKSPADQLKNVFDHQLSSQKILSYSLEHVAQRNPELKLAESVLAAFSTLNSQRFVSRDEFLNWHALSANPFLEGADRLGASKIHLDWSGIVPTREKMETEWRRILALFLNEHLLPFGGVMIGIAAGDVPCFALTDAGRYALGLKDRFEYGQPVPDTSSVVVQPNFDVVFLQPSPLAEATIARFAERKRTGLGALFKITKASVLNAAATGVTIDQVLDTLRSASTKELPANVEREISGWFASCRNIKLKSTILIHCPDAQTAARVVSLSGRKAVLLNETVVELQDTKYKPNLLKKLRGEGIFTRG